MHPQTVRTLPSLPTAAAALLIAATAWIGGVAPAHADPGLVLQAGMRGGSGFRSANGGDESLALRSGGAASLALEWNYDEQRLWQVFVSHQRTRLVLGPAAAPGTAQELPLQLTHLHAGGVNYFNGPVGSGPYVVGGLGITQLSPRLPGTSTKTRASMNLGIGHEWALAKSLSLRLELRAYIVAIGSEGAFFCSGGCTVAIRADTLTQAEAAVALRLGF